tara:strand:- start:33025 stop:33771 length:747 start_codon:yes stop_codon:yes gene_type:complete
VGAHVIFTGTVWLASEALSNKPEKIRDETIVVMIEDPIPPKIEPIETEAETKVEPKPAPEPKPKPKPKPENKPKPKPKPADTPDLPPPPRKIVGLNLGSTVAGGNGPSFATGTSLDGETDSKAVDPNQAARAPEDGATDIDAPKTNRKATRIPTAGVKLVKPKPKARVKPEYPPTLRAQGIEANVVVEVSINASGKVTKARLIDGSKYDDMNTQALIAARKETFSPATRDGVAIPFTITYTIRFRLND